MHHNFLQKKNRRLRILFVGCVSVFSISFSAIAEGGANLEVARQLLNEGKAEQSATLLKQDIATLAGDADYDFLLGSALYQSNQGGEAIFAFERVLMSNPSHVDARLKAAQISVDRGNLDYANELLQPLSAQQLNSVQQQANMKIKAEIDRLAGKHTFMMRGYVLSGVGKDNNVTGGPDLDQLILPKDKVRPPGISTVTQLGTAKADQDNTGMIEIGIAMQKAVAETTWVTAEGNLRQGYNSKRADVNDGYSNLNLGVLTRSGHEYFGGAILGQSYQVAHVTYRNSLGSRLNWTHSFNDNLFLTSYLQQLAFIYPDQAIDNTTRHVAGLQLQTVVGNDGALQCGIYAGNEVAQDVTKPHFSFHLKGVSLSGRLAFNQALSLSMVASYEFRGHDATDALYLKIREDSLLLAGATLDYKFSQSWHLIPGYSYARNTSNAELYDYARQAYMLQLKWDFDNENK
jgi:hypothetical protein